MAVTAVPVVTASAVTAASAAGAAGGVSGVVAMGGGATGSIREQNGAFTTALPLVSLPGRAGTGVELTLAYDQMASAAGADRHGLGHGIGLGKAFISPEDGGTLHAAGGGSYPLRPGDTEGTGLQRYLLKDLALREEPGTLSEREGLEGVPRDYRWVLTYDDGRKNYFSAEGGLIAEQDRFGNQTAYAWELNGGQHRLMKAVDAYGQAVTFDYSTGNQVTVTSPARSDGKQPEVVLHLDGGRLTSVTYPENQTIRLAWDHTPGGQPGRLLTRVEAPSGAVTRIGYDQPHGFPVVSSLKVTDQQGKNLTPERTFRLAAEGEHAGHDFTGRGQYSSPGALFDSADEGYRYVTELSDGHSTVRSVYNSLHLLKERTTSLHVNGEPVPVLTQQLQYEGEREDGALPPPAPDLPANYAKPTKATVTHIAPGTGAERTTTETARFDDRGRQVERTDTNGAKTVTEYGTYGQVTQSTTTGADGTVAVTENTFTPDGRSLAATRELTGDKDTVPAARTTTSFTVDEHGEPASKAVTWADAEDARPEGDQGPEKIAETYTTGVDTEKHTRATTVTTDAGTVTRVEDLATGAATPLTGTGRA
ncbi:hypothetical protein [Streptomyces sp. NPDC096030]|uniref:hypothetical protein n=1 Tax=Streptomyces sp. NPDC096030 TaxID=3155423 RepID=UPI00331F4D52